MTGRLSIGTAWSEASARLREERRLIAPVVLGLLLLPAVLASMVQPPTNGAATPPSGIGLVVFVAMILVMVTGQMAIVLLINGWRGSVGEAIGRAVRRLPVLILAGLVTVAPLVLTFAVALAVVTVSTGGDGKAALSSLGPAGSLVLLLFVAALLFVSVRLLPLAAVVVSGGDGVGRTLKRAFEMTRGNFWKLFGFLLLVSLTFGIAALALEAVVGSLVTVLVGRLDPWTVAMLIVALLGNLLQAIFVTVYTAMVARIAVQLDGDITSGT